MRNMATMSRWFRPLFSTPPHELGKLQPAATLLGRRPFMRRADPQHPQGVGGTASIPQVEERIMFRRIEIVAVPPATAQRLEQGNGISEAIGLRLNAREPSLQVELLGHEHLEEVDIAEFKASTRNVEHPVRSVFGDDRLLQRHRVVPYCA